MFSFNWIFHIKIHCVKTARMNESKLISLLRNCTKACKLYSLPKLTTKSFLFQCLEEIISPLKKIFIHNYCTDLCTVWDKKIYRTLKIILCLQKCLIFVIVSANFRFSKSIWFEELCIFVGEKWVQTGNILCMFCNLY